MSCAGTAMRMDGQQRDWKAPPLYSYRPTDPPNPPSSLTHTQARGYLLAGSHADLARDSAVPLADSAGGEDGHCWSTTTTTVDERLVGQQMGQGRRWGAGSGSGHVVVGVGANAH